MGPIAVVAATAWFVLGVSILVYTEKLKKHRIDIGQRASVYSGRSPWLEVNIFSKANYDSEGQKKLRTLKLLVASQVIPILIFGYAWVSL